jgi:hypothetical protein
MLKQLGEDLNPTLIHNEISSIILPITLNEDSIAEKIDSRVYSLMNKINDPLQDNVQKIASIKAILNITPNNSKAYIQDFIEKQENIFFFTSSLFPNILTRKMNDDISDRAW